MTKPDRLARPVPDALDILGQLSARGVRFAPGGPAYDRNGPFARMFLQVLAVIAGFEASLIRRRTREGTDIACQNGKLRGRQPALSPARDREIRRMHGSGGCNAAEIAALSGVSRPTVCRSLGRTADLSPRPAGTRPAPDLAQSGQLLAPRRDRDQGILTSAEIRPGRPGRIRGGRAGTQQGCRHRTGKRALPRTGRVSGIWRPAG